jgi:RNA polymerase sigma factor (sigma-70 family)
LRERTWEEGTIRSRLSAMVLGDPPATAGELEPDGDPPALAALYRQHWAEICAYVRREFGPGPPDSEDVAQAAFLRLSSRGDLTTVGNPRAFLYRCAHNIVMDHRRREAVRTRLAGDLALFEFDGATATPDSERVLSARERLEIVEATVRAMEPRRRKVLIMHAIHELNYTEIARRMGVSPTRVTQLFAEAVALCNKALREADAAGEGDCGARG